MFGRAKRRRPEEFADAVRAVVRDAAHDVVAAGLASLTESDGDTLRLVPANPHGCVLTVFLDYPTLCLGNEEICTEMFGSEDDRLRELRHLVRAVIAGRVEWRYRQITRRILLFRIGPYTQIVGTFYTEDGPWCFTREGFEPPGATAHHQYEPYDRV